jgi:hypothetical protein
MSTLTRRATVYLDPALHKALRLQSIETSRSVSELINDAVRKSVAKDLKDIPKKDVQRILASIKCLADDPRPPSTKKLSGRERCRLRQGNC